MNLITPAKIDVLFLTVEVEVVHIPLLRMLKWKSTLPAVTFYSLAKNSKALRMIRLAHQFTALITTSKKCKEEVFLSLQREKIIIYCWVNSAVAL